MNIPIVLLLSFTVLAAATKHPDEKCPYHSTVDLTNENAYVNGSYVYQGVLVPREKQSFYNYHLLFKNEKLPVPVHLRGCVCDERKLCIKLCCEKYEFYNEETFKCERIKKHMKIKWDLSINSTNGKEKLTNVFQKFIYQVGLPCQKPVPLIEDVDRWVLLEFKIFKLEQSGDVFIKQEESYLDTVSYCLTPYKSNGAEEYSLMVYSCPIESTVTNTLVLNSYAMALSVLFIVPTILVYLILKELRGNLRGKILICYLLSLVIAYSIISYINISRRIFPYSTCCSLGYTCYFFFMAAFLWLGVLCYDIWINYKETNIDVNVRRNTKRFIYYSLHVWSWSTIFTLLTIWADLSPTIDDLYKPGIGIDFCWVNIHKWSAAIYFYGPNLIILIFNMVTFAYLTVHIYQVRRDSAKITHNERFFQENAIVILRLFLIMGVSWIFDILSYCMPAEDKWQYMFIISDLINALQGLLIFTLFILKRNVLDLLKKRLTFIKRLTPRRSTMSCPTNSTTLKTASAIETSI